MRKSTVFPIYSHFLNHTTTTLWNSQMREAVKQGQSHESLLLFRQMKQKGHKPDNFTFPFIAKASGKLLNLRYSEIIHTHVVKSPYQSDMYVQTAMVDMYVKCNRIDYAYNLFERMSERDTASWNAIIVGFSQLALLDRVIVLFNQMRLDGIQPDSVTFIGLTQSVCSTKEVKFVNAVHCLGIQTGVELDVSIASTWIAAYAKCGNLVSAEKVFYGIELGCRTVVSWNSMIAGCACVEKSFKSISLYKLMLFDEFRPDISTILNLLSSCLRLKALHHGKLIHAHGIKLGCVTDISVLNTLISMYSRSGDVISARQIFDSMTEKTCVSWTSMIGGYTEKGDLDEALTLFHAMEAGGEKPDLVTAFYLISGCGQIGALDIGRWMDNYVDLKGLKSNIMVSNALIDMYAKCGSIREAKELFYAMHDKGVVSWTTMIAGCALNGEFKEALDIFFQMLHCGLTPNHITFISVLQACNHAGFLEKGWECFDMMSKVYKLNPGLDHYSCMVDLLGRKGKIKAAKEFIQNMPFRPDAGIWGALLGACKVHRNVEIGQYAADCLLEIEPQVATPYVEMANIYAATGRWDGVSAIRKMMKANEVAKSPGRSVVQVNGKTHSFTVEQRCHPLGLLIYEALDGLALQLKEEDSSFVEGYSFYHE